MIGLVWAQSANGVIGRDGTMPWHLPEDLRHFQRLTEGSTVVMGRATWESIPAGQRPLRDRRNVVLSTRADRRLPGAEVAGSLEAALAAAGTDVWIIGGARVFAEAMARADVLEVTEIDLVVDGDVSAPRIDASWQRAAVEPPAGWSRSRTGLDYRFVTYRRGRLTP